MLIKVVISVIAANAISVIVFRPSLAAVQRLYRSARSAAPILAMAGANLQQMVVRSFEDEKVIEDFNEMKYVVSQLREDIRNIRKDIRNTMRGIDRKQAKLGTKIAKLGRLSTLARKIRSKEYYANRKQRKANAEVQAAGAPGAHGPAGVGNMVVNNGGQNVVVMHMH